MSSAYIFFASVIGTSLIGFAIALWSTRRSEVRSGRRLDGETQVALASLLRQASWVAAMVSVGVAVVTDTGWGYFTAVVAWGIVQATAFFIHANAENDTAYSHQPDHHLR